MYYFGEHFKELGVKEIDRDHVRAMVKYEVVWVGNRISAAKSFGKRTCRLCMKERLAILELSETNPKKMINSRNELYGACRHGSSLKVIKKTESKFHLAGFTWSPPIDALTNNHNLSCN